MKWGPTEKENWYKQQKIQRSYRAEVVDKILKLKNNFLVEQYGALSLNPGLYPVYLIKSKNLSVQKKTILISGGVHGYETSGVHGALDFMQTTANEFQDSFNFICAPCISPWAYETINRWNNKTIDPNRSFYNESPSEECHLFLQAMKDLKPYAHIDLHETTDTDNTLFRPALEQRDGVAQDHWEIPDGFYLVADSDNPQIEFQKSIVSAVKKVTHIAPADPSGKIIGDEVIAEGVITYPLKKLFLCAGFSSAQYTTTTEVYPDSPKATPQICIQAQIAAIQGGLNYLKSRT